MTTTRQASYDVQGRLLEVSTYSACGRCEFGEDPDGSILGWYVDRGVVQGVDVSDRCLCVSVHIPGNMMAPNWRAALLVDDRCSQEQQAALLSVFTGQLGGPMADLAALIGEVLAVERVPITFGVVAGKSYIKIGDVAEARLTPLPGGSPAHLGKAESRRRVGKRQWLPHVATRARNPGQGSLRFTG